MTEQQRDFKGVWIPKAVWLDKRLTALDKIILTEIDSLDNGERGCFASNSYIAEFCQCSETKVSKSISNLIQYGYLYVQKFDGRQRELKSCLAQIEKQTCKKCEADTQKRQQSNIDNNTKNNTVNKRFIPPTLDEVKAYCLERNNNVDCQRFIDYYTANGWRVGKNKMKDWKAAVRTWENNSFSNNNNNVKRGENGIAISNEKSDLDAVF